MISGAECSTVPTVKGDLNNKERAMVVTQFKKLEPQTCCLN